MEGLQILEAGRPIPGPGHPYIPGFEWRVILGDLNDIGNPIMGFRVFHNHVQVVFGKYRSHPASQTHIIEDLFLCN
jgi:hypothetical protein